MNRLLTLAALLLPALATAQGVWTADRGDGTYRNPVLWADYSDPDVIRTGDDYWMTASSFAAVPGLQILHSTDLVNWRLVQAALPRLYDAAFDTPQHGCGVWAPSIRFHDGWYYIFWGDPDRGVFRIRTRDPRGAWSEPLLICAARGIIDPCPLWDDDGRAYLVHGWAGSRAGFKSILSVAEMSPEGDRLVGEEVLVFDGHDDHPTVEGPKFYKRGGWYYLFAPAGGVKPGWQLVLRSRSPWGPYECRKVLHQGDTATPGPHQGGWVEDVAGNSWFLHFVDCYAYGRVVHLQPMTWSDDGWCIIGRDRNGDGVGEPVDTWTKPASNLPSEVATLAGSDEFEGRALGLQWQWAAQPQTGWYFHNPSDGLLRLMCVKRTDDCRNLWETPNLLLQKVPAPDCTFTAKVRFRGAYEGDRAGIVVMGADYALLATELRGGVPTLVQTECLRADRGAPESVRASVPLPAGEVWLRVRVRRETNPDGTPRMACAFAYSTDGRRFEPVGAPFTAREGRWIGAKVGLFAQAEEQRNDGGWLDADYFRVTR